MCHIPPNIFWQVNRTNIISIQEVTKHRSRMVLWLAQGYLTSNSRLNCGFNNLYLISMYLLIEIWNLGHTMAPDKRKIWQKACHNIYSKPQNVILLCKFHKTHDHVDIFIKALIGFANVRQLRGLKCRVSLDSWRACFCQKPLFCSSYTIVI